MSDEIVELPPNSTGPKIANKGYTRGADTVLKQEVCISDPTADVDAKVTASAQAPGDAGMVVRPVVPAGSEVDGHSATIGATADAAVDTDTTGTLSGKLRGLVKLLAAFSRGSGAIAAATLRVTSASDDPINANAGATTDASVSTDTTGTLSGKIRGLVKLLAAFTRGAGAVSAETMRTTLASDDPAVATLGAVADAAVSTDTTGSVSGKLRGLVKILASVWDSTANRLIVRAEDETEYVFVNGTRLQVKWAEISATASGDTQVVAAVSTKKIRVLGLDFVVSAAVGVVWKSASTTKRNAQAFAANGGFVRDVHRGYFVETNASEALNINLSATSNVRGGLCYVEV